jgi:hypothetical protein
MDTTDGLSGVRTASAVIEWTHAGRSMGFITAPMLRDRLDRLRLNGLRLTADVLRGVPLTIGRDRYER